MFIDSHVHLDSYRNAEIGEILERGRAVGVQAVISAGTTLESTKRAVELTDVFPDFFAGVGIHPMDISEPFTDDTYAHLRDMALSTEKVLVISEVGLDFMEGTPDRADQYHAFREQIRLARELKLPIVFHSRDAHEESFRVLKEERAYEVGGIMHYFQGDAETARKVIDLGFYISLARPCLDSHTFSTPPLRIHWLTSFLRPTPRLSPSSRNVKIGQIRGMWLSSLRN